jgi:hypothetical protein
MNKDKFIKKIKIGQKVFTAYSNSYHNDWEKKLNGVIDCENYVNIKLDKETYQFNYFHCLRKNSYLVEDQKYQDEKGYKKQQVFKFFFFSKKDYDHFLANKDFYVFKELSKLAQYNFETARIDLYSIKEKFKKAKNNLTNKN